MDKGVSKIIVRTVTDFKKDHSVPVPLCSLAKMASARKGLHHHLVEAMAPRKFRGNFKLLLERVPHSGGGARQAMRSEKIIPSSRMMKSP